MSFEAVNIRLHEIAKNLDAQMPDVIAVQVMNELSAIHKKRIFGEGINTDGGKIGEYSTKSAYVSKDKFIRKGAFKPHGKPDKNGKKSTKNKTMYLAKGYSEFRDIQGRQVQFKNLKLSGSLERNIDVLKFGNSTLYGTTDSVESDKFQGLESDYNAFGLSTNEKEFLKSEINDQAIIIARQKK